MFRSWILHVYLVLAVLGWGLCTARAIGEKSNLAMIAGPLGLAVLTFLGGILVAIVGLPAYSLQCVAGLGIVGMLIWLGRYRTERVGNKPFRTSTVAYGLMIPIAVSVAALARIAANMTERHSFNQHDDFQGYLMYPYRLLAEGHLIDPFDGRRLIAGLLGKSFLDALALAHLDGMYLFFAERVLGHALLLLTLLMWLRDELVAAGRTQRFPSAALALVLGFATLSMLEARFQENISATTTASALLFAMLVLLDGMLVQGARGMRSPVALGLIAGAVCSFKSNLIPSVAFTLALAALLNLPNVLARALVIGDGQATATRRESGFGGWLSAWLVSAGVAALVMLPWMLEMHRSSATWLYPVLGNGNFSLLEPVARPLQFIDSPAGFARTILHMPLVGMVGALYLVLRATRGKGGGGVFLPGLVVFVMLAQTLAIASSTGGDSMVRYGFTFFLAGALYLSVRVVVDAREGVWQRCHSWVLRRPRLSRVCAALAAAAGLVASTVSMPRGQVLWKPSDSDVVRHAFDASERERYARIMAALPPGAAVLAYVDRPYFLDFARNRIYTPYLPCIAFPAPGFNCNRPPGELMKLLLHHGVRYLLYSYKGDANFPYEQSKEHLDTLTPIILTVTRGSLAFTDLVRYLLQHSPHLYDDGHDVVIDLQGFEDPGTFVLPRHSTQFIGGLPK